LFCNGIRCTASTRQALQTAHLIGFEMGNHTQSHVDLTKLNKPDLQREIRQTDKLLYAIDGKPHHLFRAPFGCVNERVRETSPAPIISWTIDTLDWTRISAEQIYQSVWNGRFDGAIVLLHDGYPNTVTAVKRLLADLYANGYQVLSVSALSKANACPLQTGNVYIRARKSGNAH
jgi:peptidoglycan/xylan/chitin deacetylase (PgdA/CDA1 family)